MQDKNAQIYVNPPKDCALCPRLVAFRCENMVAHKGFWNAPVPSFGALEARLLIVGLAPGLKGANFSGRPFTGDYAGDLLYGTLLKMGLAAGTYGAHAQDGLTLINTRITNAVRCVPPQNKPLPQEEAACRPFLEQEINSMPNLQVILSLGQIAHLAVLKSYGVRAKDYPFAHGAQHVLPHGAYLINSYHCSRYNTQTKRLTLEMFEGVFEQIQKLITAAG